MVVSLLMCLALITVVSFLFLFHPSAVAIVTIMIGITVIEILGFFSHIGLKANGPAAMNLILAVGLCVEFNAHIARHYVTSRGSRQDRAHAALAVMGGPVLLGAVSTFLGVAFLAAAKFPYFVLYFFNMYSIIIFLGLLNGMFLLPVLLSLVGPDGILGDDEVAGGSGSRDGVDFKNQIVPAHKATKVLERTSSDSNSNSNSGGVRKGKGANGNHAGARGNGNGDGNGSSSGSDDTGVQKTTPTMN